MRRRDRVKRAIGMEATPSDPGDLRIANIDPLGEVATSLLREAAEEIRPLYADPDALPPLPPANESLGPRDLYVGAFLGGAAAGCGALHEVDSITAEVRRMYVRPPQRRKHLGRAILQQLIAGARELGYERLILETGNRQAPAIAMYENYGFSPIPPFGEYVNDPTSRCYELRLGSARDRSATA